MSKKIDWAKGLKSLPEEFITPEMSLEAVKNDGWALEFVPEQFKTVEICKAAVEESGNVLQFVPKQFRNLELCSIAAKGHGRLRSIPKEFRTYEMCLEAMKKGDKLRDVPKEFLTVEMCTMAVRFSSLEDCLKIIPDEFKTSEFYLIIVRRDGTNVRFIPEELFTAEICWEAIRAYPIRFRPDFQNAHWSFVLEFMNKLELEKIREMSLEQFEAELLKGKTAEELLTHPHTWFRAQGKKMKG